MRISDWSSDVCSSDLRRPRPLDDGAARVRRGPLSRWGGPRSSALLDVWERSRQSAHAASSTCISACGRAPQSSRLTRPATNSLRPLAVRSEEHTSELQSLMRISYAVFCLKKKNNTLYNISQHIAFR